jgi:hypothetical protein
MWKSVLCFEKKKIPCGGEGEMLVRLLAPEQKSNNAREMKGIKLGVKVGQDRRM